ncbi:MAG: hypothetical protein ACNA8R_04045 [Nitriliruptoraceae bacterium]
MRTRLLTSMAVTLLLIGVGSAAAVTGTEVDRTSVGDQVQLRLQDRDELSEPLGDGQQARQGPTETSTSTVGADRDQDQIRTVDRDRTRDQLRDDSCEPDGDRQRDRDRDGGCLTDDDGADGPSAPVGGQVQTRVQTREATGAQIRAQEEGQQHTREQAGAPDAHPQH